MRLPTDRRIDDVIVLDVNDTNFPVGFNILREGNPRVILAGKSEPKRAHAPWRGGLAGRFAAAQANSPAIRGIGASAVVLA